MRDGESKIDERIVVRKKHLKKDLVSVSPDHFFSQIFLLFVKLSGRHRKRFYVFSFTDLHRLPFRIVSLK